MGLGLGLGIPFSYNEGVTISLGPELMSSFVNGSVSPLNTLVTSGVDITSGIALGTSGCVSNPFFAIEVGEQYCLTIPTLTINSFTGSALRIIIVGGPTGNAGALSDQIFANATVSDFVHTFTITGTDASSYLQLGAAASNVDFAALGISLKKVL